MTPSREEARLALAMTKASAERAEFLDRECAEDKTLSQRLEDLLAAHDKPMPSPLPDALAAKATIKLDNCTTQSSCSRGSPPHKRN